MKRILSLEIDSKDYLCGNCEKTIANNYCLPFTTALAKNVLQENIRCQPCLNAEKPQHKIDNNLHGMEF